MKELCDYLEVSLSKDITRQADFEGNLDRLIFKYANSGVINKIPGNLLGVRNMEGEVILLDHLLQNTKIPFDDNLVGIYIPKKELLQRTKYSWFLRMNKMQILTSKTL